MALTEDTIYESQPGQRVAHEVVNGAQIYQGALVSFDTTTGRIKPFDGTAADEIAGWATQNVLGDSAASPVPICGVMKAPFVQRLPVADLANDNTDINAKVYATDDGTFTITDPGASGRVIGAITRNISAAEAWVYCYSFERQAPDPV